MEDGAVDRLLSDGVARSGGRARAGMNKYHAHRGNIQSGRRWGPVRPRVRIRPQTLLVRSSVLLCSQRLARSAAHAHECFSLVSSQTGLRQLRRERATEH